LHMAFPAPRAKVRVFGVVIAPRTGRAQPVAAAPERQVCSRSARVRSMLGVTERVVASAPAAMAPLPVATEPPGYSTTCSGKASPEHAVATLCSTVAWLSPLRRTVRVDGTFWFAADARVELNSTNASFSDTSDGEKLTVVVAPEHVAVTCRTVGL